MRLVRAQARAEKGLPEKELADLVATAHAYVYIAYERACGRMRHRRRKGDKERRDANPSKLGGVNVCVGAFVTFNHEESFLRCVRDYAPFGGYLFRQFLPERYRFRGVPITVRPAPEPSTIVWENIGTSLRDKLLRRSLTTVLVAIVLVVSFSTVFFVKARGRSLLCAFDHACVPRTSNCREWTPSRPTLIVLLTFLPR